MGEPLNVNVHPVVDFLLLRSPAKSASTYPAILCAYPSIPSPSSLKSILYSLVCRRYRMIRLAASQWVRVGFVVY